MKKTVRILIIGLLLVISCREKPKAIIEKPISDFNLNTDLVEFKERMTELDTIRVSFDHSICEYQGYERLEITKFGDSIRVRSEYQNHDEKNAEWKTLYEEHIVLRDTTWGFGSFIARNDSLIDSIPSKYSRMVISDGKGLISYSTKGLSQALAFLRDYHLTMKELNDPKGFIYGYSEEEMEEFRKNFKQ
ncbi:hypothetical protein [Allomuricauda sp. SCSIO 65647]|uniref:hypothetical protein n=1 Tax=Allomuricauda sp. SCSIO 65647 TaxID=2908843 RepID=UPI001F3EF81F|nr:hypothetical protein [Muricauda sp. SCSIO 65647]UJH67476.1 hypothetical protein L0P89_16190 [Muricauda sp. SCSIO 65647]